MEYLPDQFYFKNPGFGLWNLEFGTWIFLSEFLKSYIYF
jgi:hypothetical protein